MLSAILWTCVGDYKYPFRVFWHAALYLSIFFILYTMDVDHRRIAAAAIHALRLEGKGVSTIARTLGISEGCVAYWGKKASDPTFHPYTHGGARHVTWTAEENSTLEFVLQCAVELLPPGTRLEVYARTCEVAVCRPVSKMRIVRVFHRLASVRPRPALLFFG
jgi:hypothetical protein